MSNRCSRAACGIALAALAAWGETSGAGAQPQATLGVRVSGGAATVLVSNVVGSTWSIQYAGSLAPTNFWQVLTNVTLTSSPYAVMDPSGPLTTARFYRAVWVQTLTNAVTTNLVWVPPGTFVMGSPAGEVGRNADETQHTVTLTRGIYMAKHLVTQAEYLAVASNNPSYFNGMRGINNYGTDLSRPVEQVRWFAATNYCWMLTEQQQMTAQIPTNWAYRLPTESEWEYACRAGTTTEFSYGADPGYTNLANYAWYSANSTNEVHEVATLLPNSWGLYDTEGNVFEWCLDWYGAYPGGPVTDPQGPPGPGSETIKVFRGGSWAYGPVDCRCAGRYSADWTTDYDYLGFRVVLAPAQ
jgi:formylglycine-generating enzyme required for sulfatase activity